MSAKVSKRSIAVVDAFGRAAQTWGWEIDQGCDAKVMQRAYEEFESTRGKLLRLLARLEKKVKAQ